MLYALGLGDSVVGVTHECDYPADAGAKPHLTRSVIAAGLSAAEIDREVRERTERGAAIYELDADGLRDLQPDLIVTQQVCEVCAVSYDDVRAVAQTLPSSPHVLSLDPSTLDEVLADVRTLAAAAGAADAGDTLLGDAERRLARVRDAVAGAERPRVLALEWLDPPFAGGHWVPEMIALAGGEDVLARPGEKSRVFEWADAEAARPDVVVSMPCGYGTKRAAEETRPWLDRLAALGASRVVAVDASSYFSRPGPRLVDGVELLAHLLHPERVAVPLPGRFAELGVAAPAR
jgi:iron complex transport system substrate-binding protein